VSLSKLESAPDVARLANLLERLVAIDTQNPPGRETEAAALLASEPEAIGFAKEVRPLADGRANVVGRTDTATAPVSPSTRISTPFPAAAVGQVIRFV
jgi:acetylornithine deacetylase/succinyl-diaminopimelate desuccinylase-like protein